MPQLQLVQGAYTARSVIANAQRCVNLYPEMNTKDAEVPYTHYCTPGLVTLAQGIVAEVRQLYTASDGKLFAVIGNTVYYVPDTFVLQALGTIATQNGLVSMYDNKTTLIVLDGSLFGWSFANAGDGSTYLINDTTNSKFYRVTLMIGMSYTNNFICIERL